MGFNSGFKGLRNIGKINSTTRSHLVGYFYKNQHSCQQKIRTEIYTPVRITHKSETAVMNDVGKIMNMNLLMAL